MSEAADAEAIADWPRTLPPAITLTLGCGATRRAWMVNKSLHSTASYHSYSVPESKATVIIAVWCDLTMKTGICKRKSVCLRISPFAFSRSRRCIHHHGYQTSDSTTANFFLVACHVTNALRNWSHAMKNDIAEKTMTSMSSLLWVWPMILEMAMTMTELSVVISICQSSMTVSVLH